MYEIRCVLIYKTLNLINWIWEPLGSLLVFTYATYPDESVSYPDKWSKVRYPHEYQSRILTDDRRYGILTNISLVSWQMYPDRWSEVRYPHEYQSRILTDDRRYGILRKELKYLIRIYINFLTLETCVKWYILFLNIFTYNNSSMRSLYGILKIHTFYGIFTIECIPIQFSYCYA